MHTWVVLTSPQLRTMRQMVADDSYSETSPGSMTPDDNSDMLLGGDLPQTNVSDLRPDPAHAAALWQIYLDRVNPLTKIIHVPSVQPFIDEVTAGRAHNLPKNVEALLFSIYLMAVVSMTPDECRTGLGVAREEALQKFSTGTRLILLRIGFLRVQDMTTLRALVIYLVRKTPPTRRLPATDGNRYPFKADTTNMPCGS